MIERVRRVATAPRNLAVAALAIGIAGIVLGMFVPHIFTVTVPPLVALGGLLATGLHERTDVQMRPFSSLPRRPLLSAYFFLLSAAVVAYVLSPGYGRPLSVHVIVVGLYVIAAFGVFGFDSEYLSLGLVFVTALFHRALVYYASALQLGIDAIFHNRMASQVAAAGSIEPLAAAGSKYWYSPVYHVLVAITSAMTGLPIRDAAFLAVTALSTILPALVVYVILRSFWGPRIAVSGALLFVAADRVISWNVHVTPSSLGFTFFALALLASYRYLETDQTAYLGVYWLLVLGQMFNHQVSFFVTAVGIGTFLCAHAVWTGMVSRRELALVVPLVGGSGYQGFVTKYDGPGGDQTIIEVLLSNLSGAFRMEPERMVPPLSGREAVVSGVDALSSVHALGFGLLVAFAVLGTVFWSKRTEESHHRFLFSLGTTVVVMFAFVFVLPLVGISVHFPLRWFPFLYFCLVPLAAPGVVAFVSFGTKRFTLGRNQVVALLLLVALVFTPYAVLMTWNYPGAFDGPVFDSAPGAQRLSTTTTEAELYSHVHEFGSESTVVADMMGRRTLEHGYGQDAIHYHTEYRRSGPAFTESSLFVDRAYARSNHALYYLEYRTQQIPVLGPIPAQRSQYSVVYSADSDRLLYKPATGDG
jgi:hypothetical protein